MGVFENIFKKIIYQIFFQKTLLSDFFIFLKVFHKICKATNLFQKYFYAINVF